MNDVKWHDASDDSYRDHPDNQVLVRTDVAIRVDVASNINSRTPHRWPPRLQSALEDVVQWAWIE